MQAALAALYAGDDPLSVVGQETLEILDTLQALDPLGLCARARRRYPDTEFGLGLRQIAMLVKAEVGPGSGGASTSAAGTPTSPRAAAKG